MGVKALLTNELATVSTKTLHFSLPTLVTLCLLGVTNLLQDLSYLEKVLDVESGGEAGHATFRERGRFATVGTWRLLLVTL